MFLLQKGEKASTAFSPFLLSAGATLFFFTLLALKGGRLELGGEFYIWGSTLLFGLSFLKIPGGIELNNPRTHIQFHRFHFIFFAFILSAFLSNLAAARSWGIASLLDWRITFAHFLNFFTFSQNVPLRRVLLYCAGAASLALSVLFLSTKTFFPFPNENLAAGYIAACIFLFWRLNSDDKKIKYAVFLASFLQITAIVQFHSRAALLAFSASTLFFILFSEIRKKFILLILSLACLGLLVIHPQFRNKWQSPGGLNRAIIWQSAIKAWSQAPLLGWGKGNFETAYKLNKIPMEEKIARFEPVTRFAHNQVLQKTVEYGIIGLSFLLLFAVLVAKKILTIIMTQTKKLIPVTSAILAIILSSFFDFNLELPVIALLLILLLTEILEDLPTFTFFKGEAFLKKFSVLFFLTTSIFLAAGIAFSSAHLSNKHWQPILLKLATYLNPLKAGYFQEYARISLPPKAESLLLQATKLQFSDESAWRDRLTLYRALNDREKAQAVLKILVILNPSNVFYRWELAQDYAKENNLDLAKAEIQTALQYEPLFLRGHLFLAQIFEHTNNLTSAKEAKKNVEKIIAAKISPRSPYEKNLLDSWK